MKMIRLSNATHNLVKNFKEINIQAVQNFENVKVRFHKKIEGTIAENWVKYWKNVFRDYKDVVVDVKKDIVEKPLKAMCITSVLGSITYCVKHNPTEVHFRDAYLTCANQLILVHRDSQKPETAQHLKQIQHCYNQRSVRRLNIGVASIIWIDSNSSFCDNYYSTCPHLQLQYTKFVDRILDVGFLDRWWILSKKMIDYDINY